MINSIKLAIIKTFDYLFLKFLSERSKNRIEATILLIAIASFIIHLIVIFCVDFGLIDVDGSNNLLRNPIAAIYTPFSFILVYEVYLLIYYLPKSITVYIGKQYEIITLILIRRLFKDLASLQITPEWFSVKGDKAFTYDLVATLLLFFLISVFYSLNPQKEIKDPQILELSANSTLFIRMKNGIATLLVPVFVGMAVYSLINWVRLSFFQTTVILEKVPRIDVVFFDQFFTILILSDVLLLLISFLRTDRFSTVIRNSGFVISTILIKLSFGVEGFLNIILIVVAVLFGVIILALHNQFDKLKTKSL